MAWSLEIHHLGLRGSGDCTLIVAREVGVAAHAVARIQAVLVDGGHDNDAADINAYIDQVMPEAEGIIKAVVVTHYDADHFNGVRGLLALGGLDRNFDAVRIYDQGWSAEGMGEENYARYLRAMNGRRPNDGQAIAALAAHTRTRPTSAIRSTNTAIELDRDLAHNVANLGPPAIPDNDPAGARNWLVGREIMWAGAAPAGAPTMTCVAANQVVQGGHAVVGAVTDGEAGKNRRSLGFIVAFGNFRYYVGGDMEIEQETALAPILNPGDDLAGRVVAVKASHHGAKTSNPRVFFRRLRPDAVFISVGDENQYSHPDQRVLNYLEGYNIDSDAEPRPSVAVAADPIDYYLTGYQYVPAAALPLSLTDAHGRTAGCPRAQEVNDQDVPLRRGHVVLKVSATQAGNDVAEDGVELFNVEYFDMWMEDGDYDQIVTHYNPGGEVAAGADDGSGDD